MALLPVRVARVPFWPLILQRGTFLVNAAAVIRTGERENEPATEIHRKAEEPRGKQKSNVLTESIHPPQEMIDETNVLVQFVLGFTAHGHCLECIKRSALLCV